MPGPKHGWSDRISTRIALTLIILPLCFCSRTGLGSNPEAPETKTQVLAAAESFVADAALILEPHSEAPAPLGGEWQVATAGLTCRLTLVVDHSELSGQTTGCSESAETRPIAIGLASGGSFLFQTGRGGAGWIWSGRYVPAENALKGRREHVITGELVSFVARR